MYIGNSTLVVVMRLCLVLLSLATTAGMASFFAALIWSDGKQLLDIPLLGLFMILMLWISFSFWMATFGFFACLFRRDDAAPTPSPSARPQKVNLPRTAIVMPIYNEDAQRVFAGVQAIYESIQKTEHGGHFDLFVLSDTTDPNIWLEEELAWGQVVESCQGEGRIFYRRRRKNIARKSGNIRDFCEKWGQAYRYMVVLDADSLMTGATIREMVFRMEEDPQVGILQVPPVPANRHTFFARAQQFAAGMYGQIFTKGLTLWTQVDGNYWGHNAIIRIEAFMNHCGLPKLPGREPLGGEILSHDFVEAALIRRAGWKVRIAEDLSGSYEECPTTLIDFAKRDQRWCQGNMQHSRLVFLYGFHPISRVHLAMGVMSYLSSPLWLLFMILGIISYFLHSARENGSALLRHPLLPEGFTEVQVAVGIFILTMLLLLLPKFFAYILLLTDRRNLEAHGGAAKAGLSVLLETLLSILIAPIMMAFHSVFVVNILLGRSVQWSAQRRGESHAVFQEAVSAHAAQTNAGIITAVLLIWLVPPMFFWLSPVLLGLILSIPISVLLSSRRIGLWLSDRKLLLTPEELQVPQVIQRQRFHLARIQAALRQRCRLDPFGQVILDPAFQALHLALLQSDGDDGREPSVPERMCRLALYGGPKHLTRSDKMSLLTNSAALRWLHRMAWQQWPAEAVSAVAARPSLP